MRTDIVKAIVCASLLTLTVAARADDNSRIGVGAHYWVTLDDLDFNGMDDDGLSWVTSYQHWPSLFGLELDVEWFEKGFAGSGDDVYQPQAYLLVGKGIYAAAGIGGYYSDDEWGDKPFYAFRAGLNFEVLPSVYLDINANYRFEDWSNLNTSDIDSDTITLGAVARIGF